ncbi:MAG: aminotransferase class V-fold PLP-dependent enzyme [Halanaerobiales bacterium]|nr:aminotransferase class V-fold PLP-dependent enzyme [Halanaerobiales bacterium]
MKIKIDLFSDTGTRPSSEMRKMMAEAEVGDEQLMEDPSVNRLTKMAAQILDKEEAIYLPSGLMANQISFAVHCNPGDEIIMDHTAHPIHYEGGATAVISGASINRLSGTHGIFSVKQFEEAVRTKDYHDPQTKLLSIEQTSNLGGGTIWPIELINKLTKRAHQLGLKTHMDGARLFNAVAKTNIKASEYAKNFDSIWFDLSKGLGAPVGSVLAGSSQFINKARYWKQRLGGAMRQAGIIAAGGIYALENNLERLKEDNQNAKILAEGLANIPTVEINLEKVESNIVIFKVKNKDSKELAEALLKDGLRVSVLHDKLRAVTHLDLTRKDILEAVEIFNKHLR